jgi:hypothetical protein
MDPFTIAFGLADLGIGLWGSYNAGQAAAEQRKRERQQRVATAYGLLHEGQDVLRAQGGALADTGFAVGEGTNRDVYQSTRQSVEDDILAALGVTRSSATASNAFFGSGARGAEADEIYDWVFGAGSSEAARKERADAARDAALFTNIGPTLRGVL